MTVNYCAPCLFGLEGLLADELRRLDMQDVRAENGRVRFCGAEADMAKANVCLRYAERVLIEVGSFKAATFDELFEGTKALEWERYIPQTGAFPIKGHSLNSGLHSIPDCQKIIKKAVVERLKQKYDISWFSEEGEVYQIQFAIMKDEAVLYIDTSGAGLHKRGYRPANVAAPLRETLAAAMVCLSKYRGKEDFCDPFCGGGTIAIEAALIARNIAPGISRDFSAEKWIQFDKSMWDMARREAKSREYSGDYRIFASDLDPRAVEIAVQNAKRAGVDDVVSFSVDDARNFQRDTKRGILVANPPYGERISEKSEAGELYRRFGLTVRQLENWKIYILSSHTDFERLFGRPADKKRKLYNGMIKCELFMYL